MNRREFISGASAVATCLAAHRAFAWCDWEFFKAKARVPEGVDPRPVLSFQLATDDRRRRQNQFIPAALADSNDFSFGSDGTFTFFHISDLHEERVRLGERERTLFAKACERFRPSLCVLTGDNVNYRCKGLFEEAAGAVVGLMTEAKLPFALTFGNHDTEVIGEGWYTAAEQWAFYRRAGGRHFVDRRDPSVIGGGTSRIRIAGADGKAGFDLCILDSGDYGPHDAIDPEPVTPPGDRYGEVFDSVRAPQVAWARKVLSEGVPTLFFQHIIVPEARERRGHGLFAAARADEKPSFKADYLGPDPLKADPKRTKGLLTEGIGSVTVKRSRETLYLDGGQSIYDVWKSHQNFRGAYFGHDHANSFEGVTDEGVRLGMTKTLSTCAYNDGDLALRIFRLRADGTYVTDLVTERHPNGLYGNKV